MKTFPRNPQQALAHLCLALVLAFCSLAGPLSAQRPAAGEDAPLINEIRVAFVGVSNVSEKIVRSNMQLRAGLPLDEALIDRDIRSLYRSGLFELIEVRRETVPAGINLVFELTPKYRVLAVRFDGNVKVKARRLQKEIKLAPNLALDERQAKEDADKILEYYRKSGYSQAAVTYAVERDRSSGFGTVVFHINEGRKVRLKKITFTGNEHISARRLRKVMETKRWWFMSWLTGSGVYDTDKIDSDIDKIIDFYRDRGYLDVEVDRQALALSYPSASRMVVGIPVREGRRYHVGEITVSGNKLYDTKTVMRMLTVKTGDVFSPSKLDEDSQSVEDLYGRDGRLETRVRLVRKPNLATGQIDVEYAIEESDRFYVESVAIEGNTKTRSIVIIRELALAPGDLFDMVRMKISKARLDNTRYFDDVNLSPETSRIPNRRNLKISVKEARTGNITFGAGFSTVEKAIIFAELTQSNFDLFNYRSMFQGDGQKFRLRVQLGSESSEIMVSFEEPWFLERELALGFSAYRTSTDYISDNFELIDAGFDVYLRKRLFELVEGRLSYRFDIFEYTDVTADMQDLITDDKYTTSRVGFSLLRDDRDSLITSTRGGRFELSTEVGGGLFGGDYDFYKLEFRGVKFFPVFKWHKQVFSIDARCGVVDFFGDSTEVMLEEKFYLGGPNTLRGFEYRDVGPKDSASNPEGGQSYGYLSFEYTFDIVDPVRFAVFYDAGFVNEDVYDFNTSGYNDNWGIGLRLFVAGAPLRLDLGFPITTDEQNDEGNQFNFNFGTRF